MIKTQQEQQLEFLCAQVNELSARARRTETTMHKVREHLGIPTTNQAVAKDSGCVTANGHDVSLSQIKRALEEKGWFEISDPVQIHTRDGLIAVVTFLG